MGLKSNFSNSNQEGIKLKFTPKKVFIIENGKYQELTYEEFNNKIEKNPSYEDKLFLPLHGFLMEVTEETYKAFYKDRRRQKYIAECSKANGEISYNALTTDDFNGEEILIDKTDLYEEIERRLMTELIHKSLPILTKEEQILIKELFDYGISERQLAKKYGVSQVAIHKRKNRALAKLKKLLEN